MTAAARADDTAATQVRGHHLDRPATRFMLPDDLAAAEPPEARGLARDGVRLLAAVGDRIEHATFTGLDRFLNPGDLLVVNTSATRASAVDGERLGHGPVVVHCSTQQDDGSWVVEVRTAPAAAKPIRTLDPGTQIDVPDGVRLILRAAEPLDQGPAGPRLWRTQPLAPGAVNRMLARHGRPIRYGYLHGEWPISTYQTVFAEPTPHSGRPPIDSDPGLAENVDAGASAEMPSAGRPFSTELVTRLASRGVLFAPITLHTGVSSQETGEPPAAERFRVPARTAALVGWARATGGRVIAVGTTATRALESAYTPGADRGGELRAADGWTELVLGPERPARVVDGLITGLHDPEASHLLLLESVAGAELVQRVYDAALDRGYLWHEFGDSCLLIR
jgi:S-adenosylmethionine:tRNA ribosyltransferase-isomerase